MTTSGAGVASDDGVDVERGTAFTAMPPSPIITTENLFVINIAVINRLVFNSSLLSKTDGLDLVTIGKISMMSGDDFVILVVSLCCQDLMLGSSLEMMSSLAMVNSSLVVNFVFVLRCHDIYSQ